MRTGSVALQISHNVQIHLFLNRLSCRESIVSEQRMPCALGCHLRRCPSATINTWPVPLSHRRHFPIATTQILPIFNITFHFTTTTAT